MNELTLYFRWTKTCFNQKQDNGKKRKT